MEAGWAETGLLLADEFGDGNVPTPKDIKRWWMKPMKCYRKIGMSLRGARPRSKLGVMRVRLLPLRFAQGRNDT